MHAGAWLCVKVLGCVQVRGCMQVCGCVQVRGCANKIETVCKVVLMMMQVYVGGQTKETQCVMDKQKRCSV